MCTSRRCLTGLLIAASVAISGCGSSSSSSNSQPPVTVEIPSVVLTGVVTDNPIQDATVTATVNGQSFTSDQTTASDGSYEIEVSSEDPDALVRLEAVDPSGATRLSAIVDSFEAIEEIVDDPANDDEFNITNVTTAQEVLATRLTEDGSIDSKEELVDAVSRVETDDLLEVSAAIKLVVDSIDGVTLPDGVGDTVELAEAIVSGESTFIEDVEQSAPGALESAVDLVLSDGNATIAFDAQSVPGVYVSTDSASIFAFFTGGFGYAQPQGEGSAEMFDWQVTEDGVLNLFFGGSAPRTESVTLLGRTDDVVNVVVREEGDSGAGNASTAFYYGFTGEFTNENVPGSYSSLDDPGHLTVFSEDGTGSHLNVATGVSEDDFTWAVDDSGTLSLTDADGSVSIAQRLAGSTDDNLFLLILEMDSNGGLGHVALVDVLRTDAEVGSNEANALLLAGNTYAMTEADEIGLFSFGTDGSFHEIIQRLEGQEEQAGGVGIWTVTEGTGTWAVNAEGVISIMFPNDPSTEGAQVLSGLGEDFMTVQTSDDENSVIQVERIAGIEAALVTGSFSIVDDPTGASTETVRFSADFTGVHVGEDGVAEDFVWHINGAGRLIVELSGGDDFENETLTLHMLAGSNGDLLRFVAVNRENGVLVAVDPNSGETPDTVMTLELVRNSSAS